MDYPYTYAKRARKHEVPPVPEVIRITGMTFTYNSYTNEWKEVLEILKCVHILGRWELCEWYIRRSQEKRLDTMRIKDDNPFFRKGFWHGRVKYHDHACVPMDNGAGLRLRDVCLLLENVKSYDGDPVTPSILLWGLIFNLFQSKDAAKQESLRGRVHH